MRNLAKEENNAESSYTYISYTIVKVVIKVLQIEVYRG